MATSLDSYRAAEEAADHKQLAVTVIAAAVVNHRLAELERLTVQQQERQQEVWAEERQHREGEISLRAEQAQAEEDRGYEAVMARRAEEKARKQAELANRFLKCTGEELTDETMARFVNRMAAEQPEATARLAAEQQATAEAEAAQLAEVARRDETYRLAAEREARLKKSQEEAAALILRQQRWQSKVIGGFFVNVILCWVGALVVLGMSESMLAFIVMGIGGSLGSLVLAFIGYNMTPPRAFV